jgi:cold shock CspA family protein
VVFLEEWGRNPFSRIRTIFALRPLLHVDGRQEATVTGVPLDHARFYAARGEFPANTIFGNPVSGIPVLGNCYRGAWDAPPAGIRFVVMPRGRVAWYSAELGHGFILPEDGGPNLFVRREDIKAAEQETLENKDRVSYEVFCGHEGLEAKGVYKVFQ